MPTLRLPQRANLALLFVAALSCAVPDLPTSARLDGRDLFAARRAKTPSVEVVDPAYGYEGEAMKRVRIIGSGFAEGAIAAWERNGIVDPKIEVVTTTVLSSSEIEATINIAPDATLALYDVSVLNRDKGKGIGTEKFEVTSAVSLGTLGGNTQMNAATDNSTGVSAVGWSFGDRQYAVAWPGADGALEILGPGRANAIDVAGTTVGGSSGSHPVIWVRDAAGWTTIFLPLVAGATGGEVYAIASDENGAAYLIGGTESVPATKNTSSNRPLLWRRTPDGWVRAPLAGSTGTVRGMNAAGQAVGGSAGSAAFWDSDGVLTSLPGGEGLPAIGIDSHGKIVAGLGQGAKGETKAVYWTAAISGDGGRIWTGPFDLPGNCARASGVDDAGRIIAHRCLVSSTRFTSAVIEPPYTSATKLTGFGDRSDAGAAWGVSRLGTRIVGHAGFIGALWENVMASPF